jgi:SAM-dependent methyltransferase
MALIPHHDVFGYALLDWVKGSPRFEALERDDGFTQEGAGGETYLAALRDWPEAEQLTVRELKGKVLDVGSGAGRVSLHLQQKGFDVVALDSSPLATKAARRSGVRHVRCSDIEALGDQLALFDCFILFGNNFGIFGSVSNARRQLTRLATLTKESAVVYVESTNPYGNGAPAMTRSYYFANRRAGRAPGHLRVRFRYDNFVGPWFNWLYVSRDEMKHIVRGTGWRIEKFLGAGVNEPYVGVLLKD